MLLRIALSWLFCRTCFSEKCWRSLEPHDRERRMTKVSPGDIMRQKCRRSGERFERSRCGRCQRRMRGTAIPLTYRQSQQFRIDGLAHNRPSGIGQCSSGCASKQKLAHFNSRPRAVMNRSGATFAQEARQTSALLACDADKDHCTQDNSSCRHRGSSAARQPVSDCGCERRDEEERKDSQHDPLPLRLAPFASSSEYGTFACRI